MECGCNMIDHLNTNGLVDGRIPPGETCQFFEKCGNPTDYCPIPGRLNQNRFSCGFARFLSLVEENKKDEKSSDIKS